MGLVCEVTFDRDKLKSEIRSTYARVAEQPDGDFHFHRGPDYAASMLGYDRGELAELPDYVTAPFAGVGNPLRVRDLPAGATVIDLGSGGGMDCLLAGRRVGRDGAVIGFDMTDAMLDKARAGATETGMRQVRFEKADIGRLPLEDGTVDIAISNGVINLSPEKRQVFAELHRVLRPGGWVQFADIVIETELSEKALNDIELWVG
jgi:SAM-dependent methyltransferase